MPLDRLVPDARAEGDEPRTPAQAAYFLIMSSLDLNPSFTENPETGGLFFSLTGLSDFISRLVSWYASVRAGTTMAAMTSGRHGCYVPKMWSTFHLPRIGRLGRQSASSFSGFFGMVIGKLASLVCS